MIFIPTPLLILAWIISVLLLVNSSVILINIFDFPADALRHVVSFLAAVGAITSLVFIVATIFRRFDLTGRR